MAIKYAACINNNIVVDVANYDEDNSKEWLEAVKSNYDKVLVVENAGIGWILENNELVPAVIEEISDESSS